MRRTVVFTVYEGIQLLDLAGPLEVFALAERFCPGHYDLVVASSDGGPLRTSSGLVLTPDRALAELRRAPDTIVVPGGEGTPAAMTDAVLLGWLRARAPRTRRVTSVCSGSFVLAEAGLLDGCRATVHWSECDRLARRYPGIEVDPDAIFVRDGNRWTSAGITAGIDLALALIEDDLGRDVALAVARWLVVFVRRPGGQSQFSTQLGAPPARLDWLRDLQAFIAEHPDADCSVAALARRASVSERHVARTFAAELATTPAAYVEQTRVETARRLLEDTALGLEQVAQAAGFGSVETLRRAFHRRLGVAPSDYRARFRATG